MQSQDTTKRKVIAYIRASTEEQADSGLGLEAQRDAIEADVCRRGWDLLELISDPGFSAKDLKRPGIQRALSMLASGEADVLMVAKLDRLSRSMLDFASVMETSRNQRWELVMLDCAVDTTTAAGELLSGILAMFAQFERRLISQRTKDALAVKKAQGVRLGRPEMVTPGVRARIFAELAAGESNSEVARRLNADGVPTAQGGRQWYPSTVRQLRVAA